MKTLKILFYILISTLLYSCGLKPITSEYAFIKSDIEEIDLDHLGNGKVLIYNDASILHTLDNTARLNIWINNKALGQIRPKEYAIINFEPGTHQFKVLHIDFVNIKSEHTVDINQDSKVIRVKPTISSNKLEITNTLPEKFERFTYAEKRE
ncbi:hypothetical protein FNB79_12225 [Formosa sediminum]|uniref:DUF2846 domain-containing protein n=1 Tax=Formosa sediminum TaxID=2594004 RepID=A0A516GT49_9FLAO|nr:hypothetical protein [Formosa sediminum]QDO94694.1 hypothetical protein FNB79_12225 [Formosa sediminum]